MKRKWLSSLWIITGIIIVVHVGLIVAGYLFKWGWTGFPSKTLWDWLNLLGVLAIPIVVAFGVTWYTQRQTRANEAAAEKQREADLEKTERQRKTDLEIAADNQHEAALQAYIDKMSDFLLHENLRHAAPEDEVRRMATLQTLTVLPRLDGRRKGSVLLFLAEAGLIKKRESADESEPNIMLGAAGLHSADLHGCDLSNIPGASLYNCFISYANLVEANFTGVHLQEIYIVGGNLNKAKFIDADLRNAEFFGTNMRGVDLTGANLTDASLVAVDLTGATVTKEQLDKAKLQNVTMPDVSNYSHKQPALITDALNSNNGRTP